MQRRVLASKAAAEALEEAIATESVVRNLRFGSIVTCICMQLVPITLSVAMFSMNYVTNNLTNLSLFSIS